MIPMLAQEVCDMNAYLKSRRPTFASAGGQFFSIFSHILRPFPPYTTKKPYRYLHLSCLDMTASRPNLSCTYLRRMQ